MVVRTTSAVVAFFSPLFLFPFGRADFRVFSPRLGTSGVAEGRGRAHYYRQSPLCPPFLCGDVVQVVVGNVRDISVHRRPSTETHAYAAHAKFTRRKRTEYRCIISPPRTHAHTRTPQPLADYEQGKEQSMTDNFSLFSRLEAKISFRFKNHDYCACAYDICKHHQLHARFVCVSKLVRKCGTPF